jgi:hypothetical protein
MPIESRLFVKTSLVALVLAFLWGAAMAFFEAHGVAFSPIWAIEHAHLAFVGWLVNVVIGIALWTLPANRDRYPETRGRYPLRLPFVIYGLLNGGLLARILSEPSLPNPVAAWTLEASAVSQVIAIVLFAYIAWTRAR